MKPVVRLSFAIALAAGCSSPPPAPESCGPCDAPPAAVCADAQTARSYSAGACDSSNQCAYPFTDQACPNGCQGGACRSEPPGPLQGTYPGVYPALVSSTPLEQFMISPDESHLAVASKLQSMSPFTGTLSLLAVNPGSDSVPVQLTTKGDFYFSKFLPDGRYLFSDAVDANEVGNLTLVNPDGSGRRTLATGIHPVYSATGTGPRFGTQVGGSRVFFQQGTHAAYCEIDGGAVVDLDPGKSSDLGYIAPDGSAAVYGERGSGSGDAFYLYTVATASRVLLANAGTVLGESRWSPSGKWLFYSQGDPFQTSSALPFVIRSDGTGQAKLSTKLSRFVGFLPNDSGVIYGVPGNSGGVIVVHRFDGSPDIEITTPFLSLSYQGSGVVYSAAANRVFVAAGSQRSGDLYSASAAASGALTKILGGLEYNFWGGVELSPDGAFVAAYLANNQLVLLRGDGTGSPTVVGDGRAAFSFEETGAGKLLAFTEVTGSYPNLTGRFAVLSPDGSGSPYLFANKTGRFEGYWLGKLAIEQVAGATTADGDDIWAAPDDGSVTGTLARHVAGLYNRSGGRRAFLRAASNAGGGFWVIDLPNQ